MSTCREACGCIMTGPRQFGKGFDTPGSSEPSGPELRHVIRMEIPLLPLLTVPDASNQATAQHPTKHSVVRGVGGSDGEVAA